MRQTQGSRAKRGLSHHFIVARKELTECTEISLYSFTEGTDRAFGYDSSSARLCTSICFV